MSITRRGFMQGAAAAPLLAGGMRAAGAAQPPGLESLTAGVKPIGAEERRARVAKVQGLMHDRKIAALLIESGSTLEYFTGIRWWRSERTTAALIPAQGEILVVTPAFEEPSVRETLQVGGEVRPWNEHESPFALLARGAAVVLAAGHHRQHDRRSGAGLARPAN